MCEFRLCKDISVNSVGRALALADRHHAVQLKGVCLRFAAQNLCRYSFNNSFSPVHIDIEVSLLYSMFQPRNGL